MGCGYNGKILHVDLTHGELWAEEPGDAFFRTYLGGPGIGLYYLLKEVRPETDALSPGNVLTFAAGALAGFPGPATCRFTVCAKSPLTGLAGKSVSGGRWAAALKMAGWDAVVVHGQSPKPAYLWIDGDGIEIRDASHLWGVTTGDAQDAIRRELGDEAIRVAQVGPAGENLVRFANITNELVHFNGRNGLGAVMGSKRLRAIAVRGSGQVRVKDPAALAAINDTLKVDPKYGGPGCGALVALGSNCGIGNLELLAKAKELCNCLGVDTISTGATIAFAMDCFENGIIGEPETSGLRLTFGNEEILLPLIEMIARRQGFGALLADGSLRAALAIGKGSERFLQHTKGQEIPFYDPRIEGALALQYALSPHGGEHCVAQYEELHASAASPAARGLGAAGAQGPSDSQRLAQEKVRAFYRTQMIAAAYDLLGICQLGTAGRGALSTDKIAELLHAATGWDVGLSRLMKAGERVTNMARVFNVREGFGRKDDILPEKFFEPFETGPLAGRAAIDPREFAGALDLYYKMAGWNTPDGRPSRAKLSELGLDWT